LSPKAKILGRNRRYAGFAVHIGGGTIGLASGLVAAFSPKGGHLHRQAGIIFVVSMLTMATFAVYLAVVLP